MFLAARWKMRLLVGDQFIDELDIGDGPLDQRGTRRDGVGLAGEQVIEDRHVAHPASTSRRVTGRADEAGPAGDEDPACPERALPAARASSTSPPFEA